jgi:hypothetical protein
MTYQLENPPLRASVNDHAKSVTSNAFRVSARTIERWGLEMNIVQGKRQPLSSEVWAAALARMPLEDHEALLFKMPWGFAQKVKDKLPPAIEFALAATQ